LEAWKSRIPLDLKGPGRVRAFQRLIDDVLQTEAALGDYGGPTNEEVVGIKTETQREAQGICFAVAGDTAEFAGAQCFSGWNLQAREQRSPKVRRLEIFAILRQGSTQADPRRFDHQCLLLAQSRHAQRNDECPL
jgi:hypothetical protein